MTTYTYNVEATFHTLSPTYLAQGWPTTPQITGTLEVNGEGFMTGVNLTYANLAAFTTSSGQNHEFVSLYDTTGQFSLFFHSGAPPALIPSLIGGLNAGSLYNGQLTMGETLLATDIRGTATCAAECPPVPVPGPEVGAGLLPALLLLVVALFARHQPPRYLAHPLDPE